MSLMRSMSAPLVAALLFVGSAAAASVRGDAHTIARLLPADVDVAVFLEDGAALRSGTAGAAATDVIGALGAFTSTREAWGRLAAQIGWSGTEAFDALLGSHAAIAARRADRDGAAAPWVVLSRVSPETERRLLDRLRPAPRKLEHGRVVLGVEDGAFLLTVAPRGKEASLLMLGPSGATALFDEILPTLKSGPAAPLSAAPEFERLIRIEGRPDVMALVRHKGGGGRWLGASLRREGDTVHLGLLLEDPALAERLRHVTPWSRRAFDGLAEGSLAAGIFERRLIEGDHGPVLIRWMRDIGIPAPDFPRDDLFGERAALGLIPATDAPLDVAVSMQTTDVAAMADAGDAYFADLLARIAQAGAGAPPFDFKGFEPGAMRKVDVTPLVAAPVRALWQQRIALVWNYRPDTDDGGGWWTVGTSAAAVERLSLALALPPTKGDPLRHEWLGLFVARPAALAGAMTARGAQPPAALRALATLSEVDLQVLAGKDAALIATGRLRFAPQAAR